MSIGFGSSQLRKVGLKPRYHSYHEGKLYASRGRKILVKDKDGCIWRDYLTIEPLSWLNYIELYNRLLRHGIHNFHRIDEHFDCVVIKGRIIFYKDKKIINVV